MSWAMTVKPSLNSIDPEDRWHYGRTTIFR
jgi:hypothetical protein